jgi:arylsulfatase A-like enzyme
MTDKPNIIIVMTDQHRADLCGREGFPLDTTPFLDHLASQGTWFDRAYTAVPICGPARVSMLTGRFPGAHRVRENRGCEYATYERDLIDVLKAEGYATALVGKNHSHLTPDRLDHWFHLSHAGGPPNVRERLDDDEIAQLPEDRRRLVERMMEQWDSETPEVRAFDQWLRELNHGVGLAPTPFPLACQGPYRAVSDAQSWIDSLDDSPFFMWLSFAEPHNPYQVPEPYFSLFPPDEVPPVEVGKEALPDKGFKWQWTRQLGEHVYPNYDALVPRARSNYLGMLRLIDDQVRRLVGWLQDEGKWENTLLIFVADHGDFVGAYGLMRKGPEMPELLMRVPLLIVGPGVEANVEPHPAFVSIVDLMPTLCERLGVALPQGTQGRSLWPLLSGEDYPVAEFDSVYGEQGFGGLHYTEEDDLSFEHCLIPGPKGPSFDELNSYSQSGTMRMVRRDDWKLVMDMQGRGQLYDLAADPMELVNRYGDPEVSGIQGEMLALMVRWTLRAADPLPYPKDKYLMKTDPRNYWSLYQ